MEACCVRVGIAYLRGEGPVYRAEHLDSAVQVHAGDAPAGHRVEDEDLDGVGASYKGAEAVKGEEEGER